MSTFIAPYGTPRSKESAFRGTPFPHDAASVLSCGRADLNTGHLTVPKPKLAKAPPTRNDRALTSTLTTAVYGMSPGGKFSFQKANTKKRFDERVRVARQVAARKGVTNFGYTGDKFYEVHARLNLRLQSRSIITHKYHEYDIVYNVNLGNNIVSERTIEFLNAIYQDVPAAVANHWSSKDRPED